MSNKHFTLPKDRAGKLFILSAPSGAGKSTIAQMLLENLSNFRRAVTTTTRKERSGEIHGVDYNFVTPILFQKMKENGEFFETVEQYGHEYGTTRTDVESLLSQGVHVLLVIDTKGAQAIAKMMTEAVLIFLKPPSLQELEKRLQGRGSEDESSLSLRLKKAKEELLDEVFFQYTVISDEVERVYRVVSSIVIAECHRKG
jgi:guanylate kinase